MFSKVDRYTSMQAMFYPNITAGTNKKNSNAISNTFYKQNKSTYYNMFNDSAYNKLSYGMKDFKDRLMAVKSGADDILSLETQIKAPVSKEYAERLNEKGEAFAKAMADLKNYFVIPRAKKADKLIEKMDDAAKKSKESLASMGVSIHSNGKFSVDIDKFTEAVSNRPEDVMRGLNSLKTMAGDVKKSTELSKNDQFMLSFAREYQRSNQRSNRNFNGSNYTFAARATSNMNFMSSGNIIDGYL